MDYFINDNNRNFYVISKKEKVEVSQELFYELYSLYKHDKYINNKFTMRNIPIEKIEDIINMQTDPTSVKQLDDYVVDSIMFNDFLQLLSFDEKNYFLLVLQGYSCVEIADMLNKTVHKIYYIKKKVKTKYFNYKS